MSATAKPTAPKSSPSAAKTAPAKEQPVKAANTGEFAFGKENYRLMLIGLGFILVGFMLMVGGGSDDPAKFSPEIFSFRRLTLSPILILIGYVIEIFAIMKRPKD